MSIKQKYNFSDENFKVRVRELPTENYKKRTIVYIKPLKKIESNDNLERARALMNRASASFSLDFRLESEFLHSCPCCRFKGLQRTTQRDSKKYDYKTILDDKVYYLELIYLK